MELLPSADTLRLLIHLPFAPYAGFIATTCDDEKLMTEFLRQSRYLPFVLAYLAVDVVLVAFAARSASYKASMLLHHALLASATAYVHLCAPQLLAAYGHASLCEISVVLLDVRELLRRFGADSGAQNLNSAMVFLAHVYTRLVVHPWLTYDVVPRAAQSDTERAAVTAGMAALIALNVYWAWGMAAHVGRIRW